MAAQCQHRPVADVLAEYAKLTAQTPVSAAVPHATLRDWVRARVTRDHFADTSTVAAMLGVEAARMQQWMQRDTSTDAELHALMFAWYHHPDDTRRVALQHANLRKQHCSQPGAFAADGDGGGSTP
jgi:hypothetical protein